MRPIPKRLMQWQEPQAFADVYSNQMLKQRARQRKVLMLSVGFANIVFWCIKAFMFNATFWETLALIAVEAAVIYYALKAEGWFSTTVTIWNNGITKSGASLWTPNFRDLTMFSVHETEDYRILEITSVKDGDVLIGVPLEFDMVRLENTLIERGLRKKQ